MLYVYCIMYLQKLREGVHQHAVIPFPLPFRKLSTPHAYFKRKRLSKINQLNFVHELDNESKAPVLMSSKFDVGSMGLNYVLTD